MPDNVFEEESQELFLRDIYFVFFRHRKKAIFFACAVIFASLFYTLFFTKKYYSSEAQLLVRIGRESVAVDWTAAPGEMLTNRRSRVEEIKTEIAIIKSIEIAEKVIDSIGLETFLKKSGEPPGFDKSFTWAIRNQIRQTIDSANAVIRNLFNLKDVSGPLLGVKVRSAAIDNILSSLDVNIIRDTSLISISYTSLNPQLAHDVLKKIIEFYLEKHISVFFTDLSYNFLKEQTQNVRNELEQTEQSIMGLKNETGLASTNEGFVIERVNGILNDKRETESSVAASKAKVKLLKEKLSNLPKILVSDEGGAISSAAIEGMKQRLNELKLQELNLLSTYTKESIPVVGIRRQINEIQNMILREEKSPQLSMVPGEIKNQLQSELIIEEGNLSSLDARLKVLNEQLDEVKEELNKSNQNSVVFAKLQRQKDANEQSYKKYSESFAQSRIDKALKMEKISNISIAQPATVPVEPIDSKRLLIIFAGFMGAVIGGIVLTFIFDKLDHTIKKPEDIKKYLNLPNLVSIPRLDRDDVMVPNINDIKNLNRIPKPKVSDDIMPQLKSSSNINVRKYFETLMHRILFSGNETTSIPHVIGVTSCRSGEGVSAVASNLAVNLARIGNGRVLLMDMKLLKLDEKDSTKDPYPNLGNLIALRKGSTTELFGPRLDQLYMLQSSKSGKSTALEDLQSIYRNEYDFVVMDMPAVFEDNSVDIIARLADKVILVVEAENQRWEAIARAKESLEDIKVNLVGAVLNKRNFYIPDWLYNRL